MRPETKEILDSVLYPWLLRTDARRGHRAGQAAGWPVTPVNEPAELLEADHLHQRGFWVHAVDNELGPLLLPGAPYRFTEGGWTLRRTAPRLGSARGGDRRTGRRPAHDDTCRRARPRGAAAARDPGARPDDGLVRPVPHRASWRTSAPRSSASRARSCSRPPRRGTSLGPTRNMLLGALVGAYGPVAPGQDDRPYNRHSMYNSLVNRGKRSCTLDVRYPEQRELFIRLVALSRRVRREPQVDDAAPDGHPRDRAAGAQPPADRPAPPSGRLCPATGRTTPASAASSTASPALASLLRTPRHRAHRVPRRRSYMDSVTGPAARSPSSPRSTTAPRPAGVR